MKEKIEIIHGSGNIWDDLGYPDADIRHAKCVIAAKIIGILDKKKLTIRRAGHLTGFAAADFSRIRNADLERFSLERLTKMLHALDERFTIKVSIVKSKAKLKEKSQKKSGTMASV